MDLASIDLNLLVALDALLANVSVTAAARKIGRTQPAMSHALGRLRELFGDELLVRSAKGMVLTPRAAELAPEVRRILEHIRATIDGARPFDAATSDRAFTIATTDYCELVLLPALLERIEAEAPGVTLGVVPVGDEAWDRLAAGGVDLIVAPVIAERAGIVRQKLFDERFVCLLREGHPAATKKMTLDRFASLRHALIAPRGRAGGYVDDALARLGRSRRVVVRIPHFLVAPHVIARSDLCLTVAERIARTFSAMLPLRAVPTPIELGGFSVWQGWHERSARDPGHVWLRSLVAEIARKA